MELYLSILIVIAAYFLKGFSGFGPALILIPSLSVLYDPTTAIMVTAFLDFMAGLILLIAVRKDIIWRFVLPLFIALAGGAFIGTLLLDIIAVATLKKVIAVTIIVFSALIFLYHDRERKKMGKTSQILRYPVGFFSGILGGMLSISGPPLVIYMKWFYEKSFFRAQLIGIFLLGAGWRLLLYQLYDIPVHISTGTVVLFIFAMFSGLVLGNRVHLNIGERTFNRLIAIIIIFPAIHLLLL